MGTATRSRVLPPLLAPGHFLVDASGLREAFHGGKLPSLPALCQGRNQSSAGTRGVTMGTGVPRSMLPFPPDLPPPPAMEGIA